MALESTGVYWKPVWNLLEGQFEALLVNAQHIKAVPGVPPTPTRELRDLTRYRARLTQEINRIASRLQKVLEDANIKLASVWLPTHWALLAGRCWKRS